MAYTPPRQESKFAVDERVVGKMRFVKADGNKAIKVLWLDDSKQTRSTIVLFENCHEDTQDDLKQIYQSGYDGEFLIGFNADKSSIVNFHPVNTQVRVKVAFFPAPEDQDPEPKVYPGRYGDMVKFNVVLEIVSPKDLRGLTLPLQLFYEKFVPVEVNGDPVTGFSSPPGNSKHCDFLSDFCDATGVWEFGEILWSNNILPELEKRIMRLEREFNVVIGSDGWVENIYPIYDYDEEETSDPVKEEMPWVGDEESEETMEINQDEPEEEEMIDPDWD